MGEYFICTNKAYHNPSFCPPPPPPTPSLQFYHYNLGEYLVCSNKTYCSTSLLHHPHPYQNSWIHPCGMTSLPGICSEIAYCMTLMTSFVTIHSPKYSNSTGLTQQDQIITWQDWPDPITFIKHLALRQGPPAHEHIHIGKIYFEVPHKNYTYKLLTPSLNPLNFVTSPSLAITLTS